jgi:hypothetical protein
MRLHLVAAVVGLACLNACAPPVPARTIECATLASNPTTYTGSRVSIRVRNVSLAQSGTADGRVESNGLWRCAGDDNGEAMVMTGATGMMGGQLTGQTWGEGAGQAAQSAYAPDFVIEGVARDVRTHRFGHDEYSALFIEDAHITIVQEADTTLPPAPPMAVEPATADPPAPPDAAAPPVDSPTP